MRLTAKALPRARAQPVALGEAVIGNVALADLRAELVGPGNETIPVVTDELSFFTPKHRGLWLTVEELVNEASAPWSRADDDVVVEVAPGATVEALAMLAHSDLGHGQLGRPRLRTYMPMKATQRYLDR